MIGGAAARKQVDKNRGKRSKARTHNHDRERHARARSSSDHGRVSALKNQKDEHDALFETAREGIFTKGDAQSKLLQTGNAEPSLQQMIFARQQSSELDAQVVSKSEGRGLAAGLKRGFARQDSMPVGAVRGLGMASMGQSSSWNVVGAAGGGEEEEVHELEEDDVPNTMDGMIHPQGPYKVKWDLTLAAIIIYSVITVPYRIAFSTEAAGFWYVLDWMVDCFFFLDICVNFRTAFVDLEDELVVGRWPVARHYLLSWFTIDVFSTVPFDFIGKTVLGNGNSGVLRSTKLLRILRLFRLLKLVRLLKLGKLMGDEDKGTTINPSVTGLAKMILQLMFIAHLLGCLWHWTAALQDEDAFTWLHLYGIADMDIRHRYVASLYWAYTTMTTVGYGDIKPANDTERGVVILGMLIGASVFGYVIGNVTSMMDDFDKKSAGYKEAMDKMMDYMLEKKFPQSLRLKIRQHFKNYYTRTNMMNMHLDMSADALGLLPAGPACTLIFAERHKTVAEFTFLQQNPPLFVAQMLLLMRPFTVQLNEVLYTEGELGTQLFLLAVGEVQFYIKRRKQLAKVLAAAQQGTPDRDEFVRFSTVFQDKYFGEVPLLLPHEGQPTAAAATRPCELYFVEKEALLVLLDRFPAVDRAMGERAARLHQTVKDFRRAVDNAERRKLRAQEAVMASVKSRLLAATSRGRLTMSQSQDSGGGGGGGPSSAAVARGKGTGDTLPESEEPEEGEEGEEADGELKEAPSGEEAQGEGGGGEEAQGAAGGFSPLAAGGLRAEAGAPPAPRGGEQRGRSRTASRTYLDGTERPGPGGLGSRRGSLHSLHQSQGRQRASGLVITEADVGELVASGRAARGGAGKGKVILPGLPGGGPGSPGSPGLPQGVVLASGEPGLYDPLPPSRLNPNGALDLVPLHEAEGEGGGGGGGAGPRDEGDAAEAEAEKALGGGGSLGSLGSMGSHAALLANGELTSPSAEDFLRRAEAQEQEQGAAADAAARQRRGSFGARLRGGDKGKSGGEGARGGSGASSEGGRYMVMEHSAAHSSMEAAGGGGGGGQRAKLSKKPSLLQKRALHVSKLLGSARRNSQASGRERPSMSERLSLRLSGLGGGAASASAAAAAKRKTVHPTLQLGEGQDAARQRAQASMHKAAKLMGEAAIGGDGPGGGGGAKGRGPEINAHSVLLLQIPPDKFLKRTGFFHPNSMFKSLWDISISLLIIYSVVEVTYRLAFDHAAEGGLLYLSWAIDLLFAADMAVTFRTAIYDDHMLIIKQERVASTYFKSWFWIDFSSTIPLNLMLSSFVSGDQLRGAKLIRALRLIRLMKVIRLIKMSTFFKKYEDYIPVNPTFIRFLKLFMIMSFAAHLYGCGFYSVANYSSNEETWVNSYCLPYEDGNPAVECLHELGLASKYLAAVYWAFTTMTTVGYGDIYPDARNRTEIVVTFVCQVTATTLFAYVIGALVNLVLNLNPGDKSRKQARGDFNIILSDMNSLTNRQMRLLRRQYNHRLNTKPVYLDEQVELLEPLPMHLRIKVIYFLYRRPLKHLPVLGYFERKYRGFLTLILPKLKPCLFSPGEYIISQYICAREMYFVLKGRCMGKYTDTGKFFRYYDSGQYFGEATLTVAEGVTFRLTYEVRALTRCQLFGLPKEVFDQLDEYFPALARQFAERVIGTEAGKDDVSEGDKLRAFDPEQDTGKPPPVFRSPSNSEAAAGDAKKTDSGKKGKSRQRSRLSSTGGAFGQTGTFGNLRQTLGKGMSFRKAIHHTGKTSPKAQGDEPDFNAGDQDQVEDEWRRKERANNSPSLSRMDFYPGRRKKNSQDQKKNKRRSILEDYT